MLVVPSVKYHLPAPDEPTWKEDEYAFTTKALEQVWRAARGTLAMPVEKDFSPTLAGSSRSRQQTQILEWLERVPRLIRHNASGKVLLGVKVFNTVFEDEFQLRMLERLHATGERADFLIYANRLFDANRVFEGKRGVAFGGPDLSERNLATLERFQDRGQRLLPFSATGDIHSGRIAAEYLLRGASSFQMHTLFQLPAGEFAMPNGSKTEKALHRLLFDPQQGFIAWMLHLRRHFEWPESFNVSAAARWCAAHWPQISAEASANQVAPV
jgi:hypothetical protein